MAQVLVVDDNAAIRSALQLLFELHDIEVVTLGNPAEVPEAIAHGDIGVVLQDMNFTAELTSGKEGLDLFRRIRALDPDLPVVLMTAWGSVDLAVQLMKEGAVDYLTKPWNDEKLLATVRNMLDIRQLSMDKLRRDADFLRERSKIAAQVNLCGIIYKSESMHRVLSLAVSVAAADVPVLITGPNGSGKEKVAEIIQANSRRKDKPFVIVNAGGLPDDLLESELFGAEAGAYTGAQKSREGRFEAADGGTLFLDEIGNLSPKGQMKLLRVLQSGRFERLGSTQGRKVDVRLISATNADLSSMIASEEFREDLFYRINVIEISVPPLRQRPEDILPLAEHFLNIYGSGQNGQIADTEHPLELSSSVQRVLLDYDWPGNVRELQNRIQRACLVGDQHAITVQDLGIDSGAAHAVSPAEGKTREDHHGTKEIEESKEREMIQRALEKYGGVISRAAADLGLSCQALYRRLDKLNIPRNKPS